MIISLGYKLPYTSCSLPEIAGLAAQVTGSHLPKDHFCLTLLHVGVTWPQVLLPAPVVSYTAFSPLHSTRRQDAVYFCGPIRRVSPSRVLPGTLPYGVRTFLNGK
jgi:hypothetical protein